MDNNIKKRRELIKAVLSRLENQESTTDQEFEALSKELKKDPELLDFYVEFMVQHSGLTQSGMNSHTQVFSQENLDHCMVNSAILTQLSLEERSAPTMKHSSEAETIPFKKQSITKYYPLVAMFAIVVSCIVSIVFWIDRHDNKSIAAQVIDTLDVKWEASSRRLRNNDLIYDNNRLYTLEQGTIKILFEDGARVVIDGPATFSIKDSDRMNILGGKVFVHVPNKSIGFRVDTPSCDVVDLGTEFGINVNSNGESDVYLYKGKAMLLPEIKNEDNFSQVISKNEARHISSVGNILNTPFSETEFIRDFDSKKNIVWKGKDLSLADIVTGGDGFGIPEENTGIDHLTGQIVRGNSENKANYEILDYISVNSSSYIDGVFVPDGGNGPVQLTSAGHTYSDFDDTGGAYYMPIGVYSYVTLNYSNASDYETKSIHLNGYPEGEAVNLCMHANSGITFDLDKIRKHAGFAKIKGFSSVIGIPVTYEDQENVYVDFFVFIDGKPIYVKKELHNTDNPETINIPIADDAHFLTLVTTEGGNNFGDWSVFVNPVLDLELPEYE